MVNPHEQKYPIVAVGPLVDDYRRVRGGGGENIVTSEQIESTLSRLHKECEAIRARLGSSQQGTQGFGVARLKLKTDSLAKTKRPRKVFNAETCPVIGDLDEAGEFLVLVSPAGLDSLQKKLTSLQGRDAASLVSVQSFSDLGLEQRFTSQSQQVITIESGIICTLGSGCSVGGR